MRNLLPTILGCGRRAEEVQLRALRRQRHPIHPLAIILILQDDGRVDARPGEHPRHVLDERGHRAEAVLARGREREQDRKRMCAV